jgi:hypothetical protein
MMSFSHMSKVIRNLTYLRHSSHRASKEAMGTAWKPSLVL